jgi:hypothetical protein
MAGVGREHVSEICPGAPFAARNDHLVSIDRGGECHGRPGVTPAAMSAPLCRAISPTMRWRVMRTFTPAVQAPVGMSIVPYSRQRGTDGEALRGRYFSIDTLGTLLTTG